MAIASTAKPQVTFGTLPAVGKALIGVLIVAAMGFGYYTFLHGPLEEATLAAEAEHETLSTQLAEAQRQQAEYIRLRDELTRRQGLREAHLRILPVTAEVPSLVADLNRLAELSGVQIRSLEPRPEEAQPQYVRIPVALSFRSRFHQLVRFFNNVSHLERAISMENISLTNPTVQGDDVLLTISATAITFRRNEQSANPTR